LAFTYKRIDIENVGTRKAAFGTFTNSGGSTGGDIVTGLNVVENFAAFYTNSSTTSPYADETFPLAGGVVSLVTGANDGGVWIAFGY